MCGGIREMQSRRPPRLHEEMKHHLPHAPADTTTAFCRHQPAAPAGLAIVAALVQSGGTTSPNKAAESAPSSPIPISSSSSSANNRKDNFPSYKESDHITIDHPTVKNHSRHTQTSIFSTSFSPPGCNSYIMSSNLYRDLYDDFLGVCLSCKRPLAPGKDIYMYRGDQAFCSTECRHKHIVADESLLCNIQINQPCVQASSPTNQPKFTPPIAIAILV